MRYRIDFTLMPNSRINIFRQNLINDGVTPIKMAITNLTEGELKRGVTNLLSHSDDYTDKGVLKKGEKGIVSFCIYDTPRKIPTSRNVTFSHFINSKDYVYRILDTNEVDETKTWFYDSSIDIGQYLKYKGNPNVLFNRTTEPKIDLTKEPIEEVKEEIVEQIIEEPVKEVEEHIVEEKVEVEPVEEEKFVCEVEGCGKEYATERGYKNHMKKVHGIEV